MADTGYHSRDGLKGLDGGPWKTRIAEPKPQGFGWHGDDEARAAVFGNRSRLRSGVGKQAVRKRGEMSAIDGETAMLVIIIHHRARDTLIKKRHRHRAVKPRWADPSLVEFVHRDGENVRESHAADCHMALPFAKLTTRCLLERARVGRTPKLGVQGGGG